MPTPEYILELRELIGHRYLLVPSVTAAIFDGAGRLLVVRITAREDEFWTFPGGLIEPGERPEDALKREVQEETGLHVRVTGIVGMHGGEEFQHTYANGDIAGYVMGTYRCEVTGGTAAPDEDEIAELRWVTLAEALALPAGGWFPEVVRDVFAANA